MFFLLTNKNIKNLKVLINNSSKSVRYAVRSYAVENKTDAEKDAEARTK